MNRTKSTILSGADETPVYRLEADQDGPTAVVFAGIHGNEETTPWAGNRVKCWSLTEGEVIVVPEANKYGLARGHRSSREGDLNRMFPRGREPTSELARALWDLVVDNDADYVVDLHRSQGLSGGRSPSGKGQCIYPTPSGRDAAEDALSHMTEHVPSDIRGSHEVRVGNDQSGYNDLLSHKVGGDLDPDTIGWLVEVTTYRMPPAIQAEWLEHSVETLLHHATGGSMKVEDYGHHEGEPRQDVLEAYDEGSGNNGNGGGSGDELSTDQQVAQSIVEDIQDDYDLPI